MDYTVNRPPTAIVVMDQPSGSEWTDAGKLIDMDGVRGSAPVPFQARTPILRISGFGLGATWATPPTGLRVGCLGHTDGESQGPSLYARLVPDGCNEAGGQGLSPSLPIGTDGKVYAGGAMSGWDVTISDPSALAVDIWVGNSVEGDPCTVYADSVWIELAFD